MTFKNKQSTENRDSAKGNSKNTVRIPFEKESSSLTKARPEGTSRRANPFEHHERERQEAAPQNRHRCGPRRCLVPDGTVADACAAAEASGRVGKRRIRTFALPDGCEIVAGDRIADAVEDGEELRPVFEEAGEEGGPDEGARREGAGQGEEKRRRVEHGQGAAAVSGSPEGGARDEGKEGSNAENDGESAGLRGGSLTTATGAACGAQGRAGGPASDGARDAGQAAADPDAEGELLELPAGVWARQGANRAGAARRRGPHGTHGPGGAARGAAGVRGALEGARGAELEARVAASVAGGADGAHGAASRRGQLYESRVPAAGATRRGGAADGAAQAGAAEGSPGILASPRRCGSSATSWRRCPQHSRPSRAWRTCSSWTAAGSRRCPRG